MAATRLSGPGTSRRSLLGKGVKLAFVAPAVTVGLGVLGGVALARSPSPRRTTFRAELCRVSTVPATDFVATSAGTDPLDRGRLQVEGDRVEIRLRRARPNSTYLVQFAHGGSRDSLGDIKTDAEGDFEGTAPQALPGENRVGFFVLSRGGGDHFVSCANPEAMASPARSPSKSSGSESSHRRSGGDRGKHSEGRTGRH